MTLTTFIILALATWRFSSLLVNEDGPFNIFGKLRTEAGIYFDKFSQPYATTFWADLLMCVWCTSVWVGCGIALAYLILPTVTFYICLPFALSAAGIVIEGLNNGTSKH